MTQLVSIHIYSSVWWMILLYCPRVFTGSALGFVLTILNAGIDLVSFSEILFSIYPPLFAALVVYSVGGTGVSLWLGRVSKTTLVTLGWNTILSYCTWIDFTPLWVLEFCRFGWLVLRITHSLQNNRWYMTGDLQPLVSAHSDKKGSSFSANCASRVLSAWISSKKHGRLIFVMDWSVCVRMQRALHFMEERKRKKTSFWRFVLCYVVYCMSLNPKRPFSDLFCIWF